MNTPSPWIEKLDLLPHPEGGFYSEVFRSPHHVTPGGEFVGSRNLATCIYYLLPSGTFSAFHRLRSDELWTHADGGTLSVHVIDPGGRYALYELGTDEDALPFLHIPAHHWFAAEPAKYTDSLVTCVVAPGFDFQDFEIAKHNDLCEAYPLHKALIARLTLG
jgi:predicted cupin superfamily sugar epimerase